MVSVVSEYADDHRAPCNDGAWQKDYVAGKYNEVLSIGGGYSVNLVDFIKNGIEPYDGCRQDIDNAHDYDNGISKNALRDLILKIEIFDAVPSIRIYRTVPNHVSGENDVIHDGDWVTLSLRYAKEHGNLRYTDNYHILSAHVPANQIYWDGQHIAEFGYDSRVFEWNKSIDELQSFVSTKPSLDDQIHSVDSPVNRSHFCSGVQRGQDDFER